MRLPTVLAGLALVLPSVIVQAQRVVGYYGKTAGECPDYPSFAPAELPYELYTHLNFAFVMISDDGVMEVQHPEDLPLYKELNALKLKKPSLRTTVTVGGWDMDMAHYSKMVSTPANRQKFIESAMTFVRQHGFDGIDFDWEYPSDKLRGGHEKDPENLVTFLKEMRGAANAEVLKEGQERLILSIALPGGPFHGIYFLIPKLAQYVDWFNIMAYNLHGHWEDMVFCAAPLYDTASQTNYSGYSVHDATKSMETVNLEKFNLGLSLSGVTFTLKDKQKTVPGSPAIGPGKQGCQEKGAMAYFEAKKLADNLQIGGVNNQGLDHFNRLATQGPKMDDIGKCMYMVVNEDQWVGYDTPETFDFKIEYLKKAGFGGVSIWSMDSDSANHELTKSIHKSLTTNFIEGKPFHSGGNGEESMGSLDGNGEEVRSEGKRQAIGHIYIGSPKETAKSAAKMMALIALGIVLLA
ncbi:hypothetical protein BG011_009078 [Mortierella polycephala]|uniref:GH18 domain-containing protein n=1 Tax=Mortierella polycephala TaxID=41804 RepID=A0A9P6QB27_9FUNG|nr:hypothetical protein BG011_009078 [Mortierella polycephala]